MTDASDKNGPDGQKIWIRAGWASLVFGWLGYFMLMTLMQRSPWMHSLSGILAVIVIVAVVACALLAMRRREGGYVLLLGMLLITPAFWYFAAVAAMTVIAFSAGR